MSATVSSSFMVMRAKVSRTSWPEATGSRFAVRAFRVHLDQAHLHRGERIVEFPVTGVALVARLPALGPPVNLLFRLPDFIIAVTPLSPRL
jgi:hypothetical protein